MKKKVILGLSITERKKIVFEVQEVLSEYGCNIKTRLGLHEASENLCSEHGLIILELTGDDKKCLELEKKIKKIEGVEVQKMMFEF